MTISAVVPDIAFAGSGGAGTSGPFSLVKNGTPLVFFSNSEVVVLRYDSVTDTTPALLVEGTDYTLTGGPTAGSITLTSPQTGLLTPERLYVTTLSALAQSLDLVNGGNFSSSNLERRLDVIFQILQQHAREIKSTIRFAMFDTDEIPKTTPLGAVIDKIPYVTGTTSAPTVAYLDALVLNDLSELSTENLANIAIVAADLAGADTIGIVAAAIDDVETVADYVNSGVFDADTLNGQLPAFYLAWSNLTGVPDTFDFDLDANFAVTGLWQHFGGLELYRENNGFQGPVLKLSHDSTTPASSDVVATFYAEGKDSDGNKTNYGSLEFIISDTTNGSEDGYWQIYGMVAGAAGGVLSSQGNLLKYNTNLIYHAGNVSAFVQTILDDADASAVRTTLGLGTLATISPTGMANSSTFLRGDGAWAAPAAGGGGDLLASNNLSDLANAATARTNLGLGTAAVKNTGASGDAVPLLNVANTWSAQQTVSDGSSRARLNLNGDLEAWRSGGTTGYLFFNSATTRYVGFDGTNYLLPGANLTINGSAAWHAGNDGAGSGLDADTVDGVQGSAFALLAGASFSGNVVGTGDNTALAWDASGNNRIGLVKAGGRAPEFVIASGAALSFVHTNQATITTNISSATYTERMTITSAGEVQIGALKGRPSASSETSGTLTSASANKTIQLTGNPTINNSVFSAGDVIVMYAGASARTITAGTITTMRLDGTATTGSRTLAARGIAVLFFVSASEVIVGGGAVT